MNSRLFKKVASRNWEVPTWIWEVLLLVTVTPALVHGILSVNALPLA